MNPILLALVAALVALPLLGRLAAAPGRLVSARRGFARQVLHLGAVAATILLALEGGRPHPEHQGWDVSTVLAVMLGGLIWTEGILLSFGPISLRGRRAGEEGASGSTAETPAEAEYWSPPALPSDHGEAAVDRDEGTLSAEGEALLSRIEGLDRVPVAAIMTPRERIVSVDAEETLIDALAAMRARGHTRLPVTAGSPDRILGVVHAKDLVPLVHRAERPTILRRHLRRALRVPVDQPVAALLEEFRRHRVHVGIVSDRLGRTLGLVTMTDIYRSIAGPNGEAPRWEGTAREDRSDGR